jgi:hypothetical protein
MGSAWDEYNQRRAEEGAPKLFALLAGSLRVSPGLHLHKAECQRGAVARASPAPHASATKRAPLPRLGSTRTGKKIRDPLHDYVKLGPAAVAALDTPPLQRLRHMKQLGCASAVYPSAEHSRFTHSLGVAHLAAQMVAHLRETQPELGGPRGLSPHRTLHARSALPGSSLRSKHAVLRHEQIQSCMGPG